MKVFSDPQTLEMRMSGSLFSYADLNHRAIAEYTDRCNFSKSIESQDHRKVWVRNDLNDHLVPPPLP